MKPHAFQARPDDAHDLRRVLSDLVVRDAEAAEPSMNHIAEVKHGDQSEFLGFLDVGDIERRGIDGARDQGGEAIAGTADGKRGNIAVGIHAGLAQGFAQNDMRRRTQTAHANFLPFKSVNFLKPGRPMRICRGRSNQPMTPFTGKL